MIFNREALILRFDVHDHDQNLVQNLYAIARPQLTILQCRALMNMLSQSRCLKRRMFMTIVLEGTILFGSAIDSTVGIPLSESSDTDNILRFGLR